MNATGYCIGRDCTTEDSATVDYTTEGCATEDCTTEGCATEGCATEDCSTEDCTTEGCTTLEDSRPVRRLSRFAAVPLAGCPVTLQLFTVKQMCCDVQRFLSLLATGDVWVLMHRVYLMCPVWSLVLTAARCLRSDVRASDVRRRSALRAERVCRG